MNRYGSLLSAVVMDLSIPLGVTVRPTHGNEIGQPLLQLPPVCIWSFACGSYGSDVANEALIIDESTFFDFKSSP